MGIIGSVRVVGYSVITKFIEKSARKRFSIIRAYLIEMNWAIQLEERSENSFDVLAE